jgi:teichuronic acid biosynthesis glycosyltransferase TuaG
MALKKPKPLVSVLMPARDVENYIGESIRSVLNQRGVSFELLIFEDASTDKT